MNFKTEKLFFLIKMKLKDSLSIIIRTSHSESLSAMRVFTTSVAWSLQISCC